MSDPIYEKVARQLGLPYQLVEKTYKAYWRFIKDTIESLPLKEELTEEQFNKLKTNFNIPSLGKLNCTYERYKGVKKMFKRFINNEGIKTEEDKTTVQPDIDNG